MPPRVLVTGATGFIGARLVEALCERGVPVRAMTRRAVPPAPRPGCEWRRADLDDVAALRGLCDGIDAVVHCAGHAHAHPGGAAQAAVHDRVNRLGSLNLAHAAAASGVRRLVFLSSVKAMGAPGAQCVDESWSSPPETAYGLAKRAAEQGIDAIAAASTLQAVHLRLAMVYGAGSRGNLERMFAAVRRGWFPPLPETGSRRSLVHVSDVVGAILLALEAAPAVGGAFIVAHPEPCSGAALYRAMRTALGRSAPQWGVPAGVLRALGGLGDVAARALGRPLPLGRDVVARLLDSECYCPDRIMHTLGWRAQVDLRTGLAEVLAGVPPGVRA